MLRPQPPQERLHQLAGNGVAPAVGLCQLRAHVAAGPESVAVWDAPDVFAVPVRSVETRSRPLSDGLALVLRKRGEHLKDEPTRRVRGVYRLGSRTKRYPGGLETVVGVHNDKEWFPQPI